MSSTAPTLRLTETPIELTQREGNVPQQQLEQEQANDVSQFPLFDMNAPFPDETRLERRRQREEDNAVAQQAEEERQRAREQRIMEQQVAEMNAIEQREAQYHAELEAMRERLQYGVRARRRMAYSWVYWLIELYPVQIRMLSPQNKLPTTIAEKDIIFQRLDTLLQERGMSTGLPFGYSVSYEYVEHDMLEHPEPYAQMLSIIHDLAQRQPRLPAPRGYTQMPQPSLTRTRTASAVQPTAPATPMSTVSDEDEESADWLPEDEGVSDEEDGEAEE